ncbi:MAG: hypothetical protein ABFD76_11110 [Smithella sp.]
MGEAAAEEFGKIKIDVSALKDAQKDGKPCSTFLSSYYSHG